MIEKNVTLIAGTIFLIIILKSETWEILEHSKTVGDIGDIDLPTPDIICTEEKVELNCVIDVNFSLDIIATIVINETVPDPNKVQDSTIINTKTDEKTIGLIVLKCILL
ncbi:hypothetical protein L4D22_25035 [Photobacterium profundum]